AIMMPLMLTTVIAYVVARHYEIDSLYSGWLRRRGELIEQGRDVRLLGDLRVGTVLEANPEVIGEAASVAQLLEHLSAGIQTEFPVVDRALRFKGMITVSDMGRIAQAQAELGDVLIAADLASAADSVGPDATLLDAVRAMGVRGTASVAVVDPGSDRLL